MLSATRAAKSEKLLALTRKFLVPGGRAAGYFKHCYKQSNIVALISDIQLVKEQICQVMLMKVLLDGLGI